MTKTLHSEYKGSGFDPQSGNWIPHAATKTWSSQINKINILKNCLKIKSIVPFLSPQFSPCLATFQRVTFPELSLSPFQTQRVCKHLLFTWMGLWRLDFNCLHSVDLGDLSAWTSAPQVMVCSRPCPWRPVTEKVSQLWLIFPYKIFF